MSAPTGGVRRVSQQGRVLRLGLYGEFDVDDARTLADELRPHLAPGREVVLDLADVTFLGSAALNALLQVRREALADGGELWLSNLSSIAARVVEAAGLGEHLPLQPTRDAEGG